MFTVDYKELDRLNIDYVDEKTRSFINDVKKILKQPSKFTRVMETYKEKKITYKGNGLFKIANLINYIEVIDNRQLNNNLIIGLLCDYLDLIDFIEVKRENQIRLNNYEFNIALKAIYEVATDTNNSIELTKKLIIDMKNYDILCTYMRSNNEFIYYLEKFINCSFFESNIFNDPIFDINGKEYTRKYVIKKIADNKIEYKDAYTIIHNNINIIDKCVDLDIINLSESAKIITKILFKKYTFLEQIFIGRECEFEEFIESRLEYNLNVSNFLP